MKTAQLVTIAVSTALAVMLVAKVVPQLTLRSVAEAVWSYPDRTLNRIDSLAFDIWGQSVQVLSEHSNRGSSLDLGGGKTSPDLADQPVIESVSDSVPDLSVKLDSTAQALDRLSLDYQKAASKLGLMALGWDSLPAADVVGSVDELTTALEEDNQLAELNKVWGWSELNKITSLVAQAKVSLESVRESVSTNGLQPEAYSELKSALKYLEDAQRLVGESSNTAKDGTAYGQYAMTKESIASWDNVGQRLTELLGSWKDMPSEGRHIKVSEVAAAILAINKIPHANQLPAKDPKTLVVDLMELVKANKILLAQDAGLPVVRTWLEENPLVVKTLIANPSASTNRKVAVEYYLPAEIKGHDIVAFSPGLEVKFDGEKERYAVTGEFDLAESDTKTVSVEIADVWQLGQTESVQNQALTPEQKIGAIRKEPRIAVGSQKTAVLGSAVSRFNIIDITELLAAGGIVVVLGGLLLTRTSTSRSSTVVHEFRAFSSENIPSSDL